MSQLNLLKKEIFRLSALDLEKKFEDILKSQCTFYFRKDNLTFLYLVKCMVKILFFRDQIDIPFFDNMINKLAIENFPIESVYILIET